MNRYLRFGEVPASGRSRNWATGDLEFGVSVYDLDARGYPKDPDPDSDFTGTDMRDRIQQWRSGDEKAYVVTGKEAGVGQDGEPLLTDVTILGEWDPDQPGFIRKSSTVEAASSRAGIEVEDFQPRFGTNSWSGVVSRNGTALAYRGFGSWGEPRQAITSREWRSTGMFTTQNEGDTQVALSLAAVLQGSGYHPLRGTGFLGAIEVDVSGLPFRTLLTPESPSVVAKGSGKALIKPDLGLGIGIVGGIPLDRIRKVFQVEGERVVKAWGWDEFVAALPALEDNPTWAGPELHDDRTTQRFWACYDVPGAKNKVHRLDESQNKTLCGKPNGGFQSKMRIPFRAVMTNSVTTDMLPLKEEYKPKPTKKLPPCEKCFPDTQRPWIEPRRVEPRARWATKQTVMYHYAPSSARADIAEHGLDWRRSPAASRPQDPRSKAPVATYFFPDQQDSLDVLSAPEMSGYDLYEVDVAGLPLTPDPYQPEDAVFTQEPIPPSRVRLVPKASTLQVQAEADTEGVMVALVPPEDVSKKLMEASDAEEPLDQQHLTLLYLGSTEEAGGERGKESLYRACYDFALRSGYRGLTGTPNGWGAFFNPADDGGGVLIALWDIPGWTTFRQTLMDTMAKYGFSFGVPSTHEAAQSDGRSAARRGGSRLGGRLSDLSAQPLPEATPGQGRRHDGLPRASRVGGTQRTVGPGWTRGASHLPPQALHLLGAPGAADARGAQGASSSAHPGEPGPLRTGASSVGRQPVLHPVEADLEEVSRVQSSLCAAGSGTIHVVETHGSIPHQTMAYQDKPFRELPAPVEGVEKVVFTHLVIAWGSEPWHVVALP